MHFQLKNKSQIIISVILSSIILFGCSSGENLNHETEFTQEESPIQEKQISPIEDISITPEISDLQIEAAIVEDDQPEAIFDSESPEFIESTPQSGFGGGSEPAKGEEPQLDANIDASLPIAPEIGAVAPNFSLTTVNGEQISLHDLRGKTVLVNYWVTWCVPCIEEMPILEKLHQEFQDEDFVMLSINGISQDDLSKVMNTLGEFGVTFPVVLDEGDAVYNEFQVRFMPTSFFIDPEGVIRYIQLGSTSEDGFRSTIEAMLSEQL